MQKKCCTNLNTALFLYLEKEVYKINRNKYRINPMEEKIMNLVFTPNAPKPAGHYSQAVEHQGIVYVSGQLPIHPATGEKILDTIEAQTEQVLNNLNQILLAANSSKEKVLKTTVYISDINLWDRVNTIYAAFFGNHRPARAVVPTKELHFGFQVEIEAIATVDY